MIFYLKLNILEYLLLIISQFYLYSLHEFISIFKSILNQTFVKLSNIKQFLKIQTHPLDLQKPSPYNSSPTMK